MIDNIKPVGEWTLTEIKEACNNAASCGSCRAAIACQTVRMDRPPRLWELEPHFADDELATIRVFKAAFPWAKYMKRKDGGNLSIQELPGDVPGATGRWVSLPDILFQCVLDGQTVRL